MSMKNRSIFCVKNRKKADITCRREGFDSKKCIQLMKGLKAKKC